MTRLFLADVSGLDIKSALSRVSAYRREKAEKCRFDEDKRRCLGAELLLQSVFGESFRYTCDEHGKPRAEGVYFSLAHSGKYAVCAVGEHELGVDIEAPREISPKLAERLGGEPLARWVEKEACLKCDGIGLAAINSINGKDFHIRSLRYDGYYIAVASREDLGEVLRVKCEDYYLQFHSPNKKEQSEELSSYSSRGKRGVEVGKPK